MSDELVPPLAAVHAATGEALSRLRLEDRTTVASDSGERWRVTGPAFAGLMGPDAPIVLVVAPLAVDGPESPVWVADVPGRGVVRIDAEDALAAFLSAHPDLPAETVARLIAVNLGPRGAERVLVEDSEVESLLEERAADIPPPERGLAIREMPGGGRDLAFLAASLRSSPPDGRFRVTVARWRVQLTEGRLSFERRELLSDVLLARYGG